jgi:hypothetical protein
VRLSQTGQRSISSKESSISGGASMVPSGPRASVGGGAVWSCPLWTWSVVELIASLLVWVAKAWGSSRGAYQPPALDTCPLFILHKHYYIVYYKNANKQYIDVLFVPSNGSAASRLQGSWDARASGPGETQQPREEGRTLSPVSPTRRRRYHLTKHDDDPNGIKLSSNTHFINKSRASYGDRVAVSRIGSALNGAG